MKKQIAGAMLLTGVALGSGCSPSGNESSRSTSAIESLPADSAFDSAELQDIVDRVDAAVHYVHAATDIAKRTNNTEALEMSKILADAAIWKIDGDEIVEIAPPKNETDFKLLPAVKGDPEVLIGTLAKAGGALFDPNINGIELATDEVLKISPTWQGIAVLFETKLSIIFDETDESVDHTDLGFIARTYLQAFEFEDQLLAELGGEAYKTMIATYAAQRAETIEVKEDGLTSIGDPLDKTAELDLLFSPALSEEEKAARNKVISVLAGLRAMENKFGPGETAETNKIGLILSEYFEVAGLPLTETNDQMTS